MFLDNLATSLLRLCGHKEFSYERAAEECGLSSRFFGNIVRKTSAPTVVTLEKLCNGFQTTPDDLLLPSSGFPGELRFRSPYEGHPGTLFLLWAWAYRLSCLPAVRQFP